MANTDVNTLMANIVAVQYNPAAIQRLVLQKLSDATDGTLDVVDPTNPFVFSLETSAVTTAGFLMQAETLTRRQYPSLALTTEDLYLHMSDQDFIDRFAIPTKTQFTLLFAQDEIISKMITDPDTGIMKVVIPRNTFFTIGGINFSIQYPIEIRKLAHGGIQVVYDGSIVSPLQSLDTNLIDHEIRQSADNTWIYFTIDVQQFDIISRTNTLNSAIDFNVDIDLTAQYYYTRVYVENAAGGWDEIKTTHTDQVYDIATPTAVLTVLDGYVNISIPQIYTGNSLLNKAIRMDVYQTQGPLEMSMAQYPFSSFTATWQAYDVSDITVYTAALNTLRNVIVFCNKNVSGGSDALSFADLRSRVIQNATGAASLPITNVQIGVSLQNNGYQIVKNIDNITNRVFQATKEMPTPSDTTLITAASASIATVSMSLTSAILVDSVVNNGASITLTPDTLYRSVSGVVSLVSTEEMSYLMGLTPDKRALVVSQANYLYCPWHMVLDTTSNDFESRPYYLDSPEILTKLFVGENDTTLLQVGTGSYDITRVTNGYQLQVVTNSSDAFKALDSGDIYVQLAYIPANEKDYAYLNGTLVGLTGTGERSYTFDLSTNYNVDKNDNLELSKFFLYSTEPRLTGAPLTTEFEIIYATSAVMGSQWQPNQLDKTLGNFLLPTRIAAIAQETLRIHFGYSLSTLWAQSRSVVSSVPYKLYTVDVPRVYEKDVYLLDANGSAITINAQGQPVTTLLHAKGTPVLDSQGAQVYQYRVGDVMLDSQGKPISTDVRGMLRQIDIMLIEGPYWFATDTAATTYRQKLIDSVLGWLIDDLGALEKQLLDQTRIYFYPKTTMGTIDVMVGAGITRSIAAGQAFVLSLYVTKAVFNNTALRDRLEKTSIQTINTQLKQATISIDSMTAALREVYSNDVISVQLSGLGGTLNLPALTILDDANRCSIRKRLVALSDDSLIVEEDVSISFVLHEL
jgi:hypothetical protein